MKYAMCPKCGRRLCKGENGTKVEMECPKCGEFASVTMDWCPFARSCTRKNPGLSKDKPGFF